MAENKSFYIPQNTNISDKFINTGEKVEGKKSINIKKY